MKNFFIVLLMVFLIPSAYAGNSSGPIQNYHVMGSGKLFFYAGSINDRPACNNGAWAVDLVGSNAAAGKAIFAAILMAYSAGKTVYVLGKGTCDVWGDRETVEYIYVY